MESYKQEDRGIFQFGMDDQGRAHMMETARWAKFLAIVGFIFLALILLAGVFVGFAGLSSQLGGAFGAGLGMSVMLIYIVIGLLYLYPTYCLYKFASLLKPALNTNNQTLFNEALLNLKRVFKFIGIMMIVILAIYGIIIVFAIIGAALSF
jgi:hypothetical protein